MNGKLVPLDGGDPIPLVKSRIIIGRRSGSDIRLEFSNVSGRHCELRFDRGLWLIEDLGSTNGIKVNGHQVGRKRLIPSDEIIIARKHRYRIEYEPEGQIFLDDEVLDDEDEYSEIFGRSLLERARLKKPSDERGPPTPRKKKE